MPIIYITELQVPEESDDIPEGIDIPFEGIDELFTVMKVSCATVPGMNITPEMVSPKPLGSLPHRDAGKIITVRVEMYSADSRTPKVRLIFAQQIAKSIYAYAQRYQPPCEAIKVVVHTHLASDDDIWTQFLKDKYDRWSENVDARRPISLQSAYYEAENAAKNLCDPHPPGMG